MEKTYTKEEIVVKAKELAKMIAETEEVDFFTRAEQQVNANLRIQELIAQIKKEQKEAVNLEHYNKPEALKKVDERIDQLNDELDQIPLVQEFKRSQMAVNNILQLVATTISNEVTDEIIRTTGGNLLHGSTGGNPLYNECKMHKE